MKYKKDCQANSSIQENADSVLSSGVK